MYIFIAFDATSAADNADIIDDNGEHLTIESICAAKEVNTETKAVHNQTGPGLQAVWKFVSVLY